MNSNRNRVLTSDQERVVLSWSHNSYSADGEKGPARFTESRDALLAMQVHGADVLPRQHGGLQAGKLLRQLFRRT